MWYEFEPQKDGTSWKMCVISWNLKDMKIIEYTIYIDLGASALLTKNLH